MFAALHASVFRFLPTAAMGLLLGTLAVRTHGIVPGILAHATSNALAILAMSLGWAVEPGPWAWAACAVAAWLAWAPAAGARAAAR